MVFSFTCALATLLFGGLIFSVVEIGIPLNHLREANQKTIERIPCDVNGCDVSGITNDWEFAPSDYVLDKKTYFLLNVDQPAAEISEFPLRYSDPAFITQYQTPEIVFTPAKETWRLYSTVTHVGPKIVAVMVGYAEKASWKIDLPIPPVSLIDNRLKEELASIKSVLREERGRIEFPIAMRKKIRADGYEVVDPATAEILSGGYQIPIYLPRGKPLPPEGLSFLRDGPDLYLAQTDGSDRLLAVSTQRIGDLRFLAAIFALLFFLSGALAYFSGNTFLRKYFVFMHSRAHTVDEALKLGEGPSIEFKRNISFEGANFTQQILQTVAAFANTGDGMIFIGIDDEGKIGGIEAEDPKQKDRISGRIYQLIRQHIRPTPSIRVDFVEVRSHIICTIFVPRGEDPLHFVDGVVYVRYGSSDVKAQPEMVKRLLAQYAL